MFAMKDAEKKMLINEIIEMLWECEDMNLIRLVYLSLLKS